MLQLNGRTIQRARIPSPPIGSFALTTTTTKREWEKIWREKCTTPTPYPKKNPKEFREKKGSNAGGSVSPQGKCIEIRPSSSLIIWIDSEKNIYRLAPSLSVYLGVLRSFSLSIDTVPGAHFWKAFGHQPQGLEFPFLSIPPSSFSLLVNLEFKASYFLHVV